MFDKFVLNFTNNNCQCKMNTAAQNQQLSETDKHKTCDTNEPTDNETRQTSGNYF